MLRSHSLNLALDILSMAGILPFKLLSVVNFRPKFGI